MRVFRIAIPASQIDASRAFYEQVLGIDVDATVPSRLYFHCGDVIVAVIDWTLEHGDLQSTPDNIYLATDELDAGSTEPVGDDTGARADVAHQPVGHPRAQASGELPGPGVAPS